MIDAQTLFNISNFVFLIGTTLLIRTVLKNRKILNGYDWLGSILTFLAMLIVTGAYAMMGFWTSILFSTTTVAYWAMVSIYSVTRKFRKPKIVEVGEFIGE